MATPDYIIAQINPTVGDIDGNLNRIIAAARPYRDHPEAIVVFPELALTGYPPEDLLLRHGFIEQSTHAMETLTALTETELPALIVGSILLQDGLLFNAAFLIADGSCVHIHRKNMLPNYGIFDEKRYFAHGSAPVAVPFRNHRIGMLICEDAWHEHHARLLSAQGAESIVVINASPFEAGKIQKRHQIIRQIATAHHLPVIYANLIGGQDDILFDGASFICSPEGDIAFQAPVFEEYVGTCHTTFSLPEEEALIWKALCTGLGDYIRKNHGSGVLLGLSGGIDSALVAAIAADALGKEQVLGCLLPSEFTSEESRADAMEVAEMLGIQTLTLPITAYMDAAESALIPALKSLGINTSGWRSQLPIGGNLQSRLRALNLMALSNATGRMLLNTSNKSEIAVGYSTLYGDSCGAYAPLKDVYKTHIYRLAAWRNSQQRVIPESILHKAPTAELAPNQKDSDQLPEYPVLDAILEGFIEGRQSVDTLLERGFDADTVRRVYRLLVRSEYKRRQSPPGARVSSMHFGRDWRYPLTNGFKSL